MSTINICMTSYPKRIGNCAKVIDSILENTVLPDRIYLTLSHLEFPEGEKNLPDDLRQLVASQGRVVLNWVEENTKSFKKVFPVLQYLQDEDIIIPCDDDMLLPKDFIESRIKDFNDNNREHPITSNLCRTINMDNMVFTVYSLVQKKMLNGWERFVDDTVLKTCNDDRTCLYLCHLNGYRLVPCTKYSYTNRPSSGVVNLPIAPRSGYQYAVGQKYDAIVRKKVHSLSGGRDIGDCFGLFKQSMQVKSGHQDGSESGLAVQYPPPSISTQISRLFQYGEKQNLKHDLVYVLGKGSKFNNMEIKISITSMLKFCSHWIGNIYVVGENSGIRNPLVHHVAAPDITRTNKDANIINKILVAIKRIPDLTDNFLFCSDDILVTKKSDWEDFSPRYVFEYNQSAEARRALWNEAKNNLWDRLLLKTLDRFIGCREHIYFYEPHIQAPINKQLFAAMCRQIDYTNSKNVMIMSLWFNWLNLKDPQKRFDHRSVFSSSGVPDLSRIVERHLTYNDKAFGVKEFRDGLIELVTMDEFK